MVHRESLWMCSCCRALPSDACCLLLVLQDSPTLWSYKHFKEQPKAKDHLDSAPDALWRLLAPLGETPRFCTADSSSKKAVLGKKGETFNRQKRGKGRPCQVRPCRVLHPCGSINPVKSSSAERASEFRAVGSATGPRC